jgi:hypothetical protein
MRQPSGSKIELSSTADRLELKIPARFRPDRSAQHQLIFVGGIDLLVLVLIILIIYISIPLSSSTSDAAVRIGLGVALMFILFPTLWLFKAGLRMSFDLADKFLSHTIIQIDRRQLTRSQHLYSLDRDRPKHVKTQEISQIIVDTYQHPDLDAPKVSLMIELREIDPIRLLSSGQDLTAKEIKWLAIEISTWLNVNLSMSSI